MENEYKVTTGSKILSGTGLGKRHDLNLDHAQNQKASAIFYVITMMIAFTPRFADVDLGYRPAIVIGALWVLFFGYHFVRDYRRNSVNVRVATWGLKTYFIPHMVIHAYTIVLMILGKISFSLFSTNVTVYVPALVAVLSVYYFGKDALKLNCIAVICSYTVSVLISTLVKGFVIFPHGIIEGYIEQGSNFGGLTKNYLELHDLVLSIGYIFTFYLFTQTRVTKKNIGIAIGALLVFILGVKRISVLAVLLAVVFYVLINKLRKKYQYRICLVAGFLGSIVCYLFIYILSKGSWFFDLINSYGINPAGRNYYYQAILEYAEFKPSFLGIGRNVVTEIFNNELSYLHVGGAHSDVIKMYVENGFFLFGIWLWYYLMHVTKRYKDMFGLKAAVVYFGITIYTFTLYLTDNIEIYFICQIIGIVIPLTYAYAELSKKAEKDALKGEIR